MVKQLQIMNKDSLVAKIEVSVLHSAEIKVEYIEVVNESICPSQLLIYKQDKKEKPLLHWLLKRYNFASEILNGGTIKESSLPGVNASKEYQLQFLKYGLSATDSYWIKPDGDTIVWSELDPYTYIQDSSFSIEYKDKLLSSHNSRFKLWVKEQGQLHLYKKNSLFDFLRELIGLVISKTLDLNTAKFKVHLGEARFLDIESCAQRSEDFICAIDFLYNVKEKMMINHLPTYKWVHEVISNSNLPNKDKILLDYTKMYLLDTLLCNTDRHSNNFGFLRKMDDSVEFAPLFDFDMIFDLQLTNGNKVTGSINKDDLVQSHGEDGFANYPTEDDTLSTFRYFQGSRMRSLLSIEPEATHLLYKEMLSLLDLDKIKASVLDYVKDDVIILIYAEEYIDVYIELIKQSVNNINTYFQETLNIEKVVSFS